MQMIRSSDLWSPFVYNLPYLETEGLRYEALLPYPIKKTSKYSGHRMSGAKMQERVNNKADD